MGLLSLKGIFSTKGVSFKRVLTLKGILKLKKIWKFRGLVSLLITFECQINNWLQCLQTQQFTI